MKIILLEDVATLGHSGDVIEVREGYGRNFLLPRKLAVMANPNSLRQLEHQKAVIATKQAKSRAAAEAVAGKLGGLAVTIARKVGEQDKLFGSVTALDIADALAQQGATVDRRQIHLGEPIKALGDFDVEVKLHRDVSGRVKVRVVREA